MIDNIVNIDPSVDRQIVSIADRSIPDTVAWYVFFLKSWLGGPKHQNLRQILRFKGGHCHSNQFLQKREFICTRCAFEGFWFYDKVMLLSIPQLI